MKVVILSKYWEDIIECTRRLSSSIVPKEVTWVDPITHDVKRRYKPMVIKGD